MIESVREPGCSSNLIRRAAVCSPDWWQLFSQKVSADKGRRSEETKRVFGLLIVVWWLLHPSLPPDLLVGYEVQMASWGYLVERAAARGVNLPPLISRMPQREKESRMDAERDM